MTEIVDETSSTNAFRHMCRDGDTAGAERLLSSIDDESVSRLVNGIGGVRAMVRFLVQRRHVLHMWPTPSLEQWLTEHLREAEPMHLFSVTDALHVAEKLEHAAIVYRLKAHLKFVQPPDPTRWSRKVNTLAQAEFLGACQGGDPDALKAVLEQDSELVHAINKWAQDGATLFAAYGSPQIAEVLSILCDAGIEKRSQALSTAAWWGAVSTVEALLGHGFPVANPIDGDALWSAAVATRHNTENVSVADFEAIANLLVGAGADVNGTNRWGTTAWGIATEAARPALELLGADPNKEGDARYDRATGCSLQTSALMSGAKTDEARALDVNEAAAVGDIERVRFLLDEVYRLKPSRRGPGLAGHDMPERPLHLAAFFGHAPIAWMLITEYGYSPGSVSSAFIDGFHVGPIETWDKTVLEVAVSRGHARLVDVLMNSVDWFQGRRARRK